MLFIPLEGLNPPKGKEPYKLRKASKIVIMILADKLKNLLKEHKTLVIQKQESENKYVHLHKLLVFLDLNFAYYFILNKLLINFIFFYRNYNHQEKELH